MSIPLNPFHRWRAGTTCLDLRFPIVKPDVIREAFPAHLIPKTFDGKTFPMTFLDSTASTQQSEAARQAIEAVPYANTHASTYPSAKITTRAYERAHEIFLSFVGANPEKRKAIFLGNGATGGINRAARSLFQNRRSGDGRDTVIYTQAEHHANMLPWRTHAPRALGVDIDPERGTLNLSELRAVLEGNRNRARLVAVTGMSNVTGIFNPVEEIARMAHESGADIFVDAAQMLAHKKIDMERQGINFLAASGHKAYVRRSPGVLVMPLEACPQIPDEMGGGIVKVVSMDGFVLDDDDREEAGTPNSLGAIGLAANLLALQRIGMDRVFEHESALTRQMLKGLLEIPGVNVYGDADLDRTPRGGVVSFNIADLHHQVVSQALADYFNIATRNGCFCAQPLVSALLRATPDQQEAFERAVTCGDRANVPGMVRASLGVYSSEEDVERLVCAARWLQSRADRIRDEYYVDRDGDARRHDGWRIEPEDSQYDPYAVVDPLFPNSGLEAR